MSEQSVDFFEQIVSAFSASEDIHLHKKGTFLIREGDLENNLYYIVEGAVKLYYLSDSGEKIIRLGYNGSIMNSIGSFLNRTPSEFYIETIRQTKVKILGRAEVENMMKASNNYASFLESVLIQQIEREIDLLIDSPAMRLERVLKRSPDLFQHVPLKYIASYLRMNPETLSRIRNS